MTTRESNTSRGFVRLESSVAPLPRAHVDTDQIIPAAYLKVTDRRGLAEGLFAGWRTRADGSLDPDFVLNRPEHRGAEILLAGENFGCGSSREHAPWALVEYGFRAVLSARFADIFQANALENGLLPVVLPKPVLQELFDAVADDPAVRVVVNLAKQRVRLPWGQVVPFRIDPFARHCLLQGVDSLGYLLDHLERIETYEAEQPSWGIETRAAVEVA